MIRLMNIQLKRTLLPTLLLALLLGVSLLAACFTPQKGPKRRYSQARPYKPFDAVIVPGIPYNGTGWDSVMKARVLWSWILYKNGYVKNVIYSGSAVYTPYVEALVMGLYGEKLGIPREHIFHDTVARHSTENVYYSYLLAKQLGFKTIALATDPFQSFMLRGFTRKRFTTPIYHIPFITDSLAVYNSVNPKINARPAKKAAWESIKEKQSFGTRMKGTLGKSIDWSRYKDGKVEAL